MSLNSFFVPPQVTPVTSQVSVSHDPTPNRNLHPFHLVDASPWPLVCAFAGLYSTIGMVGYMHAYKFGGTTLALGIMTLFSGMFLWWRDIIREGTYEGNHTTEVQDGLRMGMILFIVSEIMFFFAFFWAFFHSSLSPTFNIGSVWPPEAITVISAWEVPLLNTVLLLSSGVSVTWAHNELAAGEDKKGFLESMLLTLVFAGLFTYLQRIEYLHAPFTISDGVYASCFYLLTGFHGFHVLIGAVFLAVCLLRAAWGHFSRQHHVGFECAAWYWHFVDVVWLLLFGVVYWWGG